MTQIDARNSNIAIRRHWHAVGLATLACLGLLIGTARVMAQPPADPPAHPRVAPSPGHVAAAAPTSTAAQALLLEQTPVPSQTFQPSISPAYLPPDTPPTDDAARAASELTSRVLSEARLVQAVPTIVAIAALGIGPLLILLTTGFIRISIVLALLRQAFGTAQVPSNQVMGALSLMLTLLLMTPVWNDVYQRAVVPMMEPGSKVTALEACERGRAPVQAFMIRQLTHTGGADEVWLFWKHARQTQAAPATYEEVPFRVLLPAFVLNELKTAFLIGFQIYLPFLVIDLLVAGTTMAMGLSSLPNQSLSIPLKLVMFVLVDGWHLVVDLLLRSFVA